MNDQPLLLALVAVQFLVHAAGWAMASHMGRQWRRSEGQFAAFWGLLAAGLTLYVPPWPSGSLPRNVGDLLIVAALAVQHRGMLLHWGRRPAEACYLGLLAVTGLVVSLSLTLEHGHGLRVAMVCVGVALPMLAITRLVWRDGRATMPVFAPVVAVGHALLALALLARAVQALTVAPQTKISIDAPGHLNVSLAILVMFVGGLVNLAQIRLVLGRVLTQLTAQALTDPLTGTANRRGLTQHIEELHGRARQGDHGYTVLMVDVDHFKSINDRYGHAEGDRVLKHVAQGLRDGLRVGDVVARWGGEEFCVLLPRTGLPEARALAERLTLRIAASGAPRVTVSVGVAEVHAASESVEDVIRRADGALYQAKQTGRNRVVMAAEAVPA